MSGIIAIINKMHESISAMGVVLNQVADYKCPGRNEMNKRWNELERMMKELNRPPVEITAKMVRDLHGHTGEGLMACKKALVASHGHYDKALEHLRTSGNC
jgi:hypothetical protein